MTPLLALPAPKYRNAPIAPTPPPCVACTTCGKLHAYRPGAVQVCVCCQIARFSKPTPPLQRIPYMKDARPERLAGYRLTGTYQHPTTPHYRVAEYEIQ
jgi:hypothetical protein